MQTLFCLGYVTYSYHGQPAFFNADNACKGKNQTEKCAHKCGNQGDAECCKRTVIKHFTVFVDDVKTKGHCVT